MHLALLSAFLSLAAGAAVVKSKVTYDGYQVVRVPVKNQVAKVNNVISKLGLTTWKGAPRAGAFADIVVPPSKIDAFNSEIAGMDTITMHEDLGASISEESNFHVYAGKTLSRGGPTKAKTRQPARQTRPGSNRTTRTATTCSS